MKLLIYIFFAILLTQISQPPQPRYATEVNRANKLIFSNADSAQVILTAVEEDYTQMSDYAKAVYAHLLLKLASVKFDTDILEKYEYIRYSNEYFKENERFSHLAFNYFYLSTLYLARRDYTNAIKNLLLCKEIAAFLDEDNLNAGISISFAQIFYKQKEYKKAEEYAYEALEYFEKDGNPVNISHTLFLLGLINLESNNLDEAFRISKKGMAIVNDDIGRGELLENLGKYYHAKNQPDSAYHYYIKSLNYPNSYESVSKRYLQLAELFFDLKDYIRAETFADSALINPQDIYVKKEAHSILAKIYLELNDHALFSYQNQLERNCQDSINIIEFQPQYSLIEKLYTLENQFFKQDEQKKHSMRVWTLILLPTFLFLLFLFFKQKRKRYEANLFKNILAKKEESLDQGYLLLIKDIRDDLDRAKKQLIREKISFTEKEDKIRNVYDEILFFTQEKTFLTKMNRVLNSFPDKLMKKYPDLVYKEILWCCLFMLQIPTNDIALIMEYKQTSLYKFKQRLIKKTNTANTSQFEEMLLKLVNSH